MGLRGSSAMLRVGQGLALSAVLAGGVAPVLTSLDFDLADTAGGDAITITGTDLGSAISCTVGGTSATITGNTSTTLTFSMPAKTAGNHDVVVTTAGGASNALSIEAWNPTVDSAVKLLFDCAHTAYDPVTSLWVPRYSVIANGDLTTGPGASAFHPASGGAPVFDGDGATEAGLKSLTAGTNWDDYLGPDVSGECAGSIAAVFSSTNTNPISVGAPYDNAVAIGNMHGSSGTIGMGFGHDIGVPKVFAHIHRNGVGYHTLAADASSGDMHASVARWTTGSADYDLSVDGALAGAGFDSQSGAAGNSTAYNPYPIHLGLNYAAANAGDQIFAGTIRAFAILNAKASDTFVTKFYKWSQCRHGVT